MSGFFERMTQRAAGTEVRWQARPRAVFEPRTGPALPAGLGPREGSGAAVPGDLRSPEDLWGPSRGDASGTARADAVLRDARRARPIGVAGGVDDAPGADAGGTPWWSGRAGPGREVDDDGGPDGGGSDAGGRAAAGRDADRPVAEGTGISWGDPRRRLGGERADDGAGASPARWRGSGRRGVGGVRRGDPGEELRGDGARDPERGAGRAGADAARRDLLHPGGGSAAGRDGGRGHAAAFGMPAEGAAAVEQPFAPTAQRDPDGRARSGPAGRAPDSPGGAGDPPGAARRRPAVPDVATVLREQLIPELRARGVLGAAERVDLADGHRHAPRPGTTTLGWSVDGVAGGALAVDRGAPGDGGPGAATGGVHLHIDRVEVVRPAAEPRPVPTPDVRGPSRLDTYLERRRTDRR